MEKGPDQLNTGMQMITFTLADEEYGVDIRRVKEVIRIRQITHMPRAPGFLKGLINLRGDVIPIIDLRERFGLQAQGSTEMTRVIVTEIDQRSVGMVVDAVSHVVRVDPSEIDDAPSWRGWLTREYVGSVARLDEGLVVLLDVDAILSPDDMEELDRSAGMVDSVVESEVKEELHELVQAR